MDGLLVPVGSPTPTSGPPRLSYVDISQARIVNAKQRRFAEEYSVDHNATAAAIRAGYAEGTARQQGSRLLQKPDVKQLVAKLDAEKSEALGFDAVEAMARLEALFWDARALQPKVWKGEPVTYLDPDTGKAETLLEMRAPAVAARAMEMMMKKAGLDLSHTAAEQLGEVVYTLKLDRDLRDEDETDA